MTWFDLTSFFGGNLEEHYMRKDRMYKVINEELSNVILSTNMHFLTFGDCISLM